LLLTGESTLHFHLMDNSIAHLFSRDKVLCNSFLFLWGRDFPFGSGWRNFLCVCGRHVKQFIPSLQVLVELALYKV